MGQHLEEDGVAPSRGRWRLSTRALLVCGALAALHLILHLSTVTLLTALAPSSPPLYGLLAGVHGLMPFLARRITGTPGTATITAAISGVMVAASSPSGIIVMIPLLVTGVTIDALTWRGDRKGVRPRWGEARYLLAAVILGTLLFALSLSVFSPYHLTPVLVLGTLVTRITGEVIVALVSGVLARALRRAGVGSPALRNTPDVS